MVYERISWFDKEKQRLVNGSEFFCGNVERDLTTCSAYLRIGDVNSHMMLKAVRDAGWSSNFGTVRCPEHKPVDGDKVKNKAK